MRAIFLDRDGVICCNRPDYVKNWQEFTFLARAREGLARLTALGMPIIIVTNQSAINRGLLSVETLEEINQRMVTEIEAAGGRVDRVYYCPHRPDEGCNCRKPRSGLLKQAATDLGLELKGSYLVGDAWTDIQAGVSVGCTPFLVLTGRGLRQAPQALREGPGLFRVVRDLPEAVTAILRAEGHTVRQMAWSRLDKDLTDPTAPPQFGSSLAFLYLRRHTRSGGSLVAVPSQDDSAIERQTVLDTLSRPARLTPSSSKEDGPGFLLPRRSPLKQPG